MECIKLHTIIDEIWNYTILFINYVAGILGGEFIKYKENWEMYS